MALTKAKRTDLTESLERIIAVIRGEDAKTKIEQAAEKAARTGNHKDLHDYLRLRALQRW